MAMLNNRRVYIPIYSSHQDDSWFWQGDYGKVIWAPCVAFSARWQIQACCSPFCWWNPSVVLLRIRSIHVMAAAIPSEAPSFLISPPIFGDWMSMLCGVHICIVFLGGLSLDPCSESQTPRVSRNSQFLGILYIDDLWWFTDFLRLSSSQSVKIIRGYLNTMISWRTVHVLQVASTPEPQGVSKAR